MPNYIVLDLETTGLDVTTDLPIQLACKVIRGDKQVASHSFFINPEREISPEITKLTGITNEIVRTGYSLPLAAEKWNEIAWNNYPTWLVGYNLVNFDLPILQNFLARHNPNRFKHPPLLGVIDVMFLCCQHFKQKKWPKLIDSGRRLGIQFDPDALHDALADVELTWEVYKKIKEV